MLEKALRGAVVPEDIAGVYHDKALVLAGTGRVVFCSFLTHSLFNKQGGNWPYHHRAWSRRPSLRVFQQKPNTCVGCIHQYIFLSINISTSCW